MGRIEQESLGVIIGRDYPAPVVDHAAAREKTLSRYAVVKKAAS
jgi:deoxyribodipyrimidine photo-lyase